MGHAIHCRQATGRRSDLFTREYGRTPLVVVAGLRPDTSSSSRTRSGRAPSRAGILIHRGVSSRSTRRFPSNKTPRTCRSGGRTNANKDQGVPRRWSRAHQRYVGIAKDQARDGAHLLDLCIDYVGRDGVADIEGSGGCPTASTLPIMLDSTEPEVIEAGLELLGGRCVVNSVNYEDGNEPGPSPESSASCRSSRNMALQLWRSPSMRKGRLATRVEGAVATRLIEDLTGNWGMNVSDIMVDALTFPIATGQGRPAGTESKRSKQSVRSRRCTRKCRQPSACPMCHSVSTRRLARVLSTRCSSTLPRTAFGLGDRPCVKDSADVADHRMNNVKLLWTWSHDRRRYDADGNIEYDHLSRFSLELFEGGCTEHFS